MEVNEKILSSPLKISEMSKERECQNITSECESLFSTTFNLYEANAKKSLLRNSALFRSFYLRRELKLINKLRWNEVQQCLTKCSDSTNNDNDKNNDVILLPPTHTHHRHREQLSTSYCEHSHHINFERKENEYVNFDKKYNNQRSGMLNSNTEKEEQELEEEEQSKKEVVWRREEEQEKEKEEDYHELRYVFWETWEHWNGFVFVNDKSSPWYQGVFAFSVHFPPSYPFACPCIELAGAFPSHPLVKKVSEEEFYKQFQYEEKEEQVCLPETCKLSDNKPHVTTVTDKEEEWKELESRQLHHSSHSHTYTNTYHYCIPFKYVFNKFDPMKTSMMSVLCNHVANFFRLVDHTVNVKLNNSSSNSNNNIDSNRLHDVQDETLHNFMTIDRVLAQHDVQCRSITQEVSLDSRYVNLVEHVMTPYFLHECHALVPQHEECNTIITHDKVHNADDDNNNDRSNDANNSLSFAQWYTHVVLPQLRQIN